MTDAQQVPVEVYQFRVYLREISPMIWRRLLVRSDSTIADLHYTLQIAMGWEDYHLHQFVIHGQRYGVSRAGGVGFTDNPAQVHLADFHFRLCERFLYEYDFGDGWQHEIRLEKRLPLDPTKTYPCCIGGARKAPPEDCGGPWAFMGLAQQYSLLYIGQRLLEIMEEGSREECREELSEFLYWLAVNQFDRRAVNRRLKQYALGDEAWQWAGRRSQDEGEGTDHR
jgi:hypothetical protein